MHILYTISENTKDLAHKVYKDRENGLKWSEITSKHNFSRAYLASLYKWYLQTVKGDNS